MGFWIVLLLNLTYRLNLRAQQLSHINLKICCSDLVIHWQLFSWIKEQYSIIYTILLIQNVIIYFNLKELNNKIHENQCSTKFDKTLYSIQCKRKKKYSTHCKNWVISGCFIFSFAQKILNWNIIFSYIFSYRAWIYSRINTLVKL